MRKFGTVEIITRSESPTRKFRGPASHKGQLYLDSSSGQYYRALSTGLDATWERAYILSKDELQSFILATLGDGDFNLDELLENLAGGLDRTVFVTTGNETRPDTSGRVTWVDTREGLDPNDPADFPTNYEEYDRWERVGASEVTPPPDTENPSVPTGLASTAQTTTSITVGWNAATDNVGVTGYQLRLNGGTPITKNVSPRTHVFNDLTPDTTYGIEVRSVDDAGNLSAWSTSISVTTSEEVAPPTGTLRSIFGNTTPAVLTSYDDAGDGAWVAQQFYSSSFGGRAPLPVGTKITSVIIDVPVGSSLIGRNGKVSVVRATYGDIPQFYSGAGIAPNGSDFNLSPAFTLFTGLIAGKNIIELSQELDWPGSDRGVMAALSVDGGYYLHDNTLSNSSIQAAGGDNLNFFLSESGLGETPGPDAPRRNFYNGNVAYTTQWYGLDLQIRIPD